MNYQEINPLELPYKLAASDKYRMPNIPAVYFLISEADEILYIGRTDSLFIRWSNHRILKKAKNPQNCRLAYYESAVKDLADMEIFFIHKFNPLLNRVRYHNRRPSDLLVYTPDATEKP